MRFVDEENQVVAFFDFVDDALDSFFKHAAQHRARDDAAHLQLHHMRTTQTRRNFFRFQLDQARQPFDDRSLADAWFTNQHRRICTLAMAEDLDHLLNLFFAADGRRNLVGASQPVQRNSEMFQIRRQLKLLSILFFFLFAFLHLGSYVFGDRLGICAHGSQDFYEQTVVIAQCFKNIGRFNCLAALSARALHRALETDR